MMGRCWRIGVCSQRGNFCKGTNLKTVRGPKDLWHSDSQLRIAIWKTCLLGTNGTWVEGIKALPNSINNSVSTSSWLLASVSVITHLLTLLPQRPSQGATMKCSVVSFFAFSFICLWLQTCLFLFCLLSNYMLGSFLCLRPCCQIPWPLWHHSTWHSSVL